MHTPTAAVPASLSEIFGEPIYVYTREQALEDGVLANAQVGDLAEVTRQHVGSIPCVLTSGLFGLIQRAVANPRWCNDWKGVWHDILWMSSGARRRLSRPGDVQYFRVIITGAGRTKIHTLGVDWDGESLCYMLPGEN